MGNSGILDIRNMESEESFYGTIRGESPEKDIFTPRDILQRRRSGLPDSGYSSLPESPVKPTETKLRRRSLSLQDADNTPSNRKSLCKRLLYFDTREKLTADFTPTPKRRNSKPEITNANDSDTTTSNEPRTIDILNDLKQFPHITKEIFSYLNGKNLSAVCCVSKIWNQLCKNDWRANERRRAYLHFAAMNKENPVSRNHTPVAVPRSRDATPLSVTNNRPSLTNTPKSTPTNFERFVAAGKNLPQGGYLMKCVRCSSPSQVLPSSPLARCVSPCCSFKFCSRCHYPFSDNHKCHEVGTSSPAGRSIGEGGGSFSVGSGGWSGCTSKPVTRLGSKESKNNLRRLRI